MQRPRQKYTSESQHIGPDMLSSTRDENIPETSQRPVQPNFMLE